MLYNLSHKDVCLKEGEFVLKLELMRMDADTSKPYDNSVSKTATLSRYIDAPLFSSLMSIRKDASTALEKVSSTQIGGTILVTAVAALIGFVSNAAFAPDSKVESLKDKLTKLETEWQVFEANNPSQSRIETLEKENASLKNRLQEVEARISMTSAKKGK
jgi:hypothetical protein